ncbi:hypothetical protein G3O08_05680 [Cryomorpha ignava]|uniref:tRNA_anti-like n=1 Tax=Cryomorpha ignava TaxID=101383 RepID=A0A7K3WMW6_9FLAO|nr:hypothetical protein [Cryomorpha ignava]NEN22989.1 hypothetical protein [Cryomorpha ignava]
MKKKIIFSVLILVAVAVSIGYYMFQKPVESLRDKEATWQGSSEDLYDEFTADEVAGNKTFTGNILEVTGTVVDVMQNADSSSTLILNSSHPIFGVKCRIDPKFNKVETPSKGSEVSLKGLCTGINSDVELNQCIIQ